MNKLSVIVPARNEADNLKECISEICKELTYHSINFEILVIDDGSTDNTVDIIEIRQSVPSVECITNEDENGSVEQFDSDWTISPETQLLS